jgi:nitrate reductase gamma subunit
MLSAPVRYLWRPGYQIVRSRRRAPLLSETGAVAGVAARRPARQTAAARPRPAE